MSKNGKPLLLVVDCQLLQTADRHRGMGLFLHSLLTELAPLKQKGTEWLLLTNKNLPSPSEGDLQLLKSLGQMLSVDLISKENVASFGEAQKVNRAKIDNALNAFIDNHTNQQVTFFIPALFSDEIFPVFPSYGSSNVTLFHDLIPYLYYKNYFSDLEGDRFKDYAQRFSEFYKTDLFVTNSQTTADDLTVYFGVDSGRAKALLGAGANRKHAKPSKPASAKGLADFILMPSGDDYRKNNVLAAQALADLNRGIKLVITSNFSEQTQRHIKNIYPHTLFTGTVPDEEYLWLVDNAEAILFPSEYEGLGMPLLEAVERQARVICSRIPVFIEISPTAFFYFDPKSAADLTKVITQAIGGDSAQSIKQRQQDYVGIKQRFSWQKAAQRFMDALSNAQPTPPATRKLAVFCPSPASYSAIGKCIFELHAELSRCFKIDYYAEEGFTSFSQTRPNILKYATNYYAPDQFIKNAERYDHIIYNLGNSEFHTDTILTALTLPGNAIIHDTRLNGIFDYMTNRHILTPERRQYESLLDDSLDTHDTSCLVSLATNQKAIFCHSLFAEGALNKLIDNRATHVNHLMLSTAVPAIELPRENFTVCFAGIISENKGINLVSEVGKLGVGVKVFGFGVLGDSPLLRNLGSNIEVLSDLTDKDFQDALRQANVLISYRLNYQGETSLSTLEAMRYGAVIIVNDIGWYGELPDDAVVKVNNEVEVVNEVQRLANDPEACRRIGSAAREYVLKNHDHHTYTKLLKENIR